MGFEGNAGNVGCARGTSMQFFASQSMARQLGAARHQQGPGLSAHRDQQHLRSRTALHVVTTNMQLNSSSMAMAATVSVPGTPCSSFALRCPTAQADLDKPDVHLCRCCKSQWLAAGRMARPPGRMLRPRCRQSTPQRSGRARERCQVHWRPFFTKWAASLARNPTDGRPQASQKLSIAKLTSSGAHSM